MNLTQNISDLFVSTRWYAVMGGCILLFVLSFFFPLLMLPATICLGMVMLLTVLDIILLFAVRGTVKGNRSMSPRFSLGDENPVYVTLHNDYPFTTTVKLIEQLPEQLQERNFLRQLTVPYQGEAALTYNLKPLTRGVYNFDHLLCYVHSPLSLLQRRFKLAAPIAVKVYPSYQQLKKYQLQAATDNTFTGVRKIRRLGHSMEFEKIKSYVRGDDIRTINWKATARTGDLMVNTFTDAREQQVYALIDKGRAMKMPFEGMTLLDYAINATLSLLNIVMLKHDRAGLLTFSNQVGNIVAAERRSGQMQHIMEALYQQQTEFKESDYEMLLTTVHKKISHRSLLLLFTNFETRSSLDRQLPYLKRMAERHLVCVIFFQNTLLKQIYEAQPDNMEGIYIKTIADRFDYEKKQIVKELRRHGILAVLTTPGQLTVDVINKYLELKARQMV